jgi:MerR family transcriptional regulator, light-induced transcriptional regulator
VDASTFSPKEAAEIIGVSESSIKRWVDAGHITVHRTKGGHRRIALRELVRFVRAESIPIVRPDLLGIEAVSRTEPRELTDSMLFSLLAQGNGPSVRRALVGGYLAGRSVADLVDDVVAPAFEKLGTLWTHDDDGVFIEHRAVTLCMEALHQIGLIMPERNGQTPVMVGGAPSGDPYILPTLAAALSLRDAGYLAVQLGADTPPTAFAHAVNEHRPRMVWVAMTSLQRASTLQRFIDELADLLSDAPAEIVVGGQASRRLSHHQNAGITILSSMRELVFHVREVVAS